MIRNTAIYLRGAYGPGNLGDDVLMIIMINFLKEQITAKKISVSIENIEQGERIDSSVKWIPINAPVNAKVTILGGGGQFFSFGRNPFKAKENKGILKNIKMKIYQGYKISDLITGFFLRKIFNIGYLSKEIATFCIGVGPFEDKNRSSVELARNILKKASFISVRDQKSKEEVENLVNKSADVYTDICFNRRYWFDDSILNIKDYSQSDKKTIGVVLRKWDFTDKGEDLINKLIFFKENSLKYNFKIIFLDERKDIELFEFFSSEEIISWNPVKSNVNDFLKKIKKEVDLIISCRAHGVLLSVMCHIPSLAVEIEPKLRAVHKMLPNTTRLITEQNIDNLDNEIETFLNEIDFNSNETFEQDLKSNEALAAKGLKDLKSWLSNKL